MAYWILKTEPKTYSFEDLERDRKTNWDGVRNYQARNNLRAMKRGDEVLIYHSVGPKELVGIGHVTKEAFADETASDGDWAAVEIQFQEWLKRPIKLAELKEQRALQDLSLIKQGRLSVCPVTSVQWKAIVKLAS